MPDPTVSIDEVAQQLGVPEAALRLYIAHSKVGEPDADTMSTAHAEELKQDLSKRLGSLRLDDLARATLTIEWLTESAQQNANAAQAALAKAESLEAEAASRPAPHDHSDAIAKLDQRVADAEAAASKLAQADSGRTMSMIASVQEMTERQGRDVDHLRAELAELRASHDRLASALEALHREHTAFLNSLRTALSAELPKAPAPEFRSGIAGAAQKISSSTEIPSSPQPPKAEAAKQAAGPKRTEASAEASPAPAPEKHAAGPKVAAEELQDDTGKGYENNEPEKAAKYGVKREIEFNFLYERMGFKRPDQYPKDWAGEIEGPSDEEIKAFLAQFELACPAEEVDIKIVHRGDYQMVQYQRAAAHTAFKNWIPSKKR